MKNIGLIILALFISSCETSTHVEFTIYWGALLAPIGYILLGVVIALVIIVILFKDFRPY